MEIRSLSKTGTYHLDRKESCQDYYSSIENDNYLVISLADGVTGCHHGGEGARLLCEGIQKEILDQSEYLFELLESQISIGLEKLVFHILNSNKAQNCLMEDYGSTFLYALLDKKKRKMLLINLGDGSIFSICHQREEELLPPRRIRGYPCTTTTKGFAKQMQIEFHKLKEHESILLCTDGTLDWLNEQKVRRKRNILSDTEWYNELEKIGKATVEDDCSYIMILQQ